MLKPLTYRDLATIIKKEGIENLSMSVEIEGKPFAIVGLDLLIDMSFLFEPFLPTYRLVLKLPNGQGYKYIKGIGD